MDARDRRARTLRVLFGGRPSAWGMLVPVVAMLAGLLFAASAVTAKGTSLRPSDTRGLADVVAARNHAVEAKEERVAALRHEVQTLTARNAPGSSALKQLSDKAARLTGPAGLEAVSGPVVQVSLTDSPRSIDSFGPDIVPDDLVIHQQDVQSVVNALWRGGAEAMMIQDQRVVATSTVRCVGNTLILQKRVYSPPFVIKAMGDPDKLRKALDDDPQLQILRQYVEAVSLGYDVRTTPRATFPAYDGSVTLHHATVGK
ncbi:DUF881 domain-containing protein [Arsenicicoccus dermatophilus]|uniref:DUF881 domain-containing protein n=1 Tax=Arsenicicoccus dermatophilus TaxID=1076331 RepID=UPI001F4D1020|nr:DUF881 domain-containing protein [Arsenicicoccus dermatophilus]